MHLRILYKQPAFSDFSVGTNISKEIRYLSIISCSVQDENEQKVTKKISSQT
jgi:hypothetical protein